MAAINGAAVGVGITMCLPMDIRMISTAGKIGFVFNKRGMAMEAGSCWFLPRLVGMQQAQEWVMTAELFGADEALKGGLVRSVHAPDELLPAAQALAKKFAASTSSAVAAAVNRRLMWSMMGAQDPLDAVTLDVACVGYLAAGADAQEGIKSFFEKRAPAFPLKPSKDMPPFGPWAQAAARRHQIDTGLGRQVLLDATADLVGQHLGLAGLERRQRLARPRPRASTSAPSTWRTMSVSM